MICYLKNKVCILTAPLYSTTLSSLSGNDCESVTFSTRSFLTASFRSSTPYYLVQAPGKVVNRYSCELKLTFVIYFVIITKTGAVPINTGGLLCCRRAERLSEVKDSVNVLEGKPRAQWTGSGREGPLVGSCTYIV